MDGYKKCEGAKISCGEWKLFSEFYFRKDSQKYRNQCKDCHIKQSKLWTDINIDKVKENKKNWSLKNKGKLKIDAHQRYENNKEQLIQKVKEYNKDHKEEKKEYDRQYCIDNKEKIKIKDKQKYENNKEYILERGKIYRQKNIEKIKIINKKYRKDNKEKLNSKNKIYYEENKEILWTKLNIKNKEKRKNNTVWAIRKDASTSAGKRLKRLGSSKQGKSTKNYFPWTDDEIKKDFETKFLLPENLINGKSWMTWNNRGKYDPKIWDDNDPNTWTWQLDHIKPHSEFHYETMDCQEFRDCWALSNLRPLSAKQNNADGANRTRHFNKAA